MLEFKRLNDLPLFVQLHQQRLQFRITVEGCYTRIGLPIRLRLQVHKPRFFPENIGDTSEATTQQLVGNQSRLR